LELAAMPRIDMETEETMVRLIKPKTRRAITNMARRGAQTVRSVAGDAMGAAAKAAAGVVLDSTASALETGHSKIQRSSPAMQRAAGKAARRTITQRSRITRRSRKKSTPKRRTSAAKRKIKRRAR
jgi:hypothetical protein